MRKKHVPYRPKKQLPQLNGCGSSLLDFFLITDFRCPKDRFYFICRVKPLCFVKCSGTGILCKHPQHDLLKARLGNVSENPIHHLSAKALSPVIRKTVNADYLRISGHVCVSCPIPIGNAVCFSVYFSDVSVAFSLRQQSLIHRNSLFHACEPFQIAIREDTAKCSLPAACLNRCKGNGIPLVLMGDGFIDAEISSGYYGQVMNQAVENLFTEEPIRSLQDYFDIYSVTAVSRHNIFAEGYETALSCWMEGGNSTLVGGDDLAVQEYASAVDGIDLNNAQIVVVLNTDAYGGTNYSYVDNRGNPVDFSIAYCPVIDELGSEDFRRVMVHEVVGHGIGKLDDEYSYVTQGAMPASEIADRQQQQRDYGWWMNVDFTSNRSAVLWSDFLSDSRYADQGLGVFEGACTYWTGAYRSTEESMMRSNIMGFNAPSRRAIYNNVLQRGESYTPSLEEFIAFDQQTFVPQTRAAETPSRPFARPRVLTLERLSGE